MLHISSRFAVAALALALCAPAVPLWLSASPAAAQDNAKPRPKKFKKRPTPRPLTQYAGKKLTEAQGLLSEEKFDEAEVILRALEQRRLNETEKALLYQFRAHIAQVRDEDVKAALGYYEKALNTKNGLAYNQFLDAKYRVAQLNMRLERFDVAAKQLVQWHRDIKDPESSKKASQDTYYMLAVAYAQQDQWKKATRPAVAAYKSAPNGAKRSVLEMLVQCFYNQKDYKRVSKIFEELIERFPKESYFKQLSGIYSELDRQMDAMTLRQVAYDHGWLRTDGDIRTLAQMYLFHSLPYKSAKVLEDGLKKGLVKPDEKAYKLLADAWLMARDTENSFEPLKKAAAMSSSGDLYVRLGQAYIQGDQWKDAKAALESAIAKGSLKDPGKAHLLLGVSHFNLDALRSARASFQRAAQHKQTAVSANQWLGFVAKRQAALNPPAPPPAAEGEEGAPSDAAA